MKKLLAAVAASILVVSSAGAQTVPAPTIAAKSWLLLDATSGQVIAAQDQTARIEPASLTKIMTAYVTFRAIQDKKLTLDQMVTVSTRAWKVDNSSSKMFIDPATPVKVNDLLYGLMVQSGNDAAVALAEAVAGDEGTFVTLMNREAQRMGLKNTKFATHTACRARTIIRPRKTCRRWPPTSSRISPSFTRSTRSSNHLVRWRGRLAVHLAALWHWS